ncbi:MAG TPA: rod shape-determining protein [Ruminococcaceae bacterium]|nr:rod shape-determining protein [Oscillospiraceae bacterium]
MLGTKIGFDLGTSSIVANVDGKGIKINEPSVIVYDTFEEKAKTIGAEAYKMLGKTPDSLVAVRPIRDGYIYDFESLEHMLRYYIKRICKNRIFKPNVIACVPSNTNEIEKKTVTDLMISSGAARACVIEEPLAAALGAGVSVKDPEGYLIVDIGGGTTDIAVISRGCVAVSDSVEIAGNTFDEDICRFARRERDTIIGSITAERVKKQVGAAKFLDAELAVRAVGKDYITKLPKSIELTSSDIFLCIREHLEKILESIKYLLSRTQPELVSDIIKNGMIITGGGANIRGIDDYFHFKLGFNVRCAEKPEWCVANGLGVLLDDIKVLEENGYVFRSYADMNDFEE